MNLKNFLILFLYLSNIVLSNDIVHHVKKALKIKPAYFCIEGLLDTYGFMGHRFPKRENLKMCPTVDLSCCRATDQVTMYQNWIINQERSKMEKRINFYKRVYDSVVRTSIDVYERSEFLSDLLKDKDLGNCIILSKRIQHYKIKDIKSSLLTIIRSYEDYFLKIHNGFYCAICASESHHYINLSYRTIRYTHDTCRDISKNTLKFFIYFEIHFVKFVNLMQRFLTSCNYKGTYRKQSIPVHRKLYIHGTQYKLLKRCQLFINTKHWYKHCRKICENFNIVKFNSYFTPKLKKYINFVNFAKSKLSKLEKDTRKYIMKIPTNLLKPKKKKKPKKKNSKKKGKKNTIKKKKKKVNKALLISKLPEHKRFYYEFREFGMPELFKSGSGTFVKIDNFKAKFNKPIKIRYKPLKKGLDILSYSYNTEINKSNYEQVLTEYKEHPDLQFLLNPDEYYDKIKRQRLGYSMKSHENLISFISVTMMLFFYIINN